MELPHFTGKRGCDANGPFSFLNPTTRRYRLSSHKSHHQAGEEDLRNRVSDNGQVDEAQAPAAKERNEIRVGDVERLFRTRDNRKGRHQISISPSIHQDAHFLTPPPTNTLLATVRGIIRMLTFFPYWDVSYLVALIFTIGSIDWCVNAFFVWLPLQVPSSEFPGEIANAGGISAFVGATIFEIGSVLLMIEAVNENRAECFGWALEEVLEERGLRRLRPNGCVHHHGNKKNLVGKGKAVDGKPALDIEMAPKDEPNSKSARTWTWWPTWYELKTHYFKEVGFLACLSQMVGATIFWISGFTALPPIYSRLTSTAAQNGAYWLPQVLGGTGFIISGFLFMVETQQKWYLPAPKVLGWHIGVWNLIGGIGFTLCGALGFAASNSGCVYQGSLATFWGSWCFLVGSVIQWYESLDKHPVDVKGSGGGAADTQPV
ncbi:integral membrane protein [Rhexocercosporidium sp. MPI-PUGE-AT-0058]|nr:integral membrane protein [Rhexocercosporidium sp. MPI-PUGE-AT-0058]